MTRYLTAVAMSVVLVTSAAAILIYARCTR